jgi:hypothetical protein
MAAQLVAYRVVLSSTQLVSALSMFVPATVNTTRSEVDQVDHILLIMIFHSEVMGF